MLLGETISFHEDKAPEAGFYDAAAVLSLPEKCRKRLRTTNSIERLDKEIRRREQVIRIFPNRESVIRFLGTLLMEQDEKWTTGEKYFDFEAASFALIIIFGQEGLENKLLRSMFLMVE